MAYLVKFQLAIILGLLRNGIQLNDVANKSRGGDHVSNNPKETTGLALIAPNRSPPDKAKRLMGGEHNRSPQKQTLGIIPKSNQSKIDAQHRLICPIDQFACANGLTCIPEKSLCNGVDDCEDQ